MPDSVLTEQTFHLAHGPAASWAKERAQLADAYFAAAANLEAVGIDVLDAVASPAV